MNRIKGRLLLLAAMTITGLVTGCAKGPIIQDSKEVRYYHRENYTNSYLFQLNQ